MERIIKLLEKAGIGEYSALQIKERTAELFFVKKQLDTRRIKDVEKFHVTVYRTAEADGQKLKAQTEAMLLSSMSDDEIIKALKDAYFAAQFAMNPYYEAPSPVTAPLIEKKGALAEEEPEKAAGIMAEALFAADCREDAFINSAEVFISKKRIRVVTSAGTDVSWTLKCTGALPTPSSRPGRSTLRSPKCSTSCATGQGPKGY